MDFTVKVATGFGAVQYAQPPCYGWDRRSMGDADWTHRPNAEGRLLASLCRLQKYDKTECTISDRTYDVSYCGASILAIARGNMVMNGECVRDIEF
jgi:hypothetical protein